MRTKSLSAIAALLLAAIYSCQSEKFTEKGIPEVNTLGVTILEDGVIFHGQILTDAGLQITDHGFTWVPEGSNDPSEVNHYSLGPMSGETHFSVTIHSTIEKDKIYRVRAFLATGEKISFGNEVSFSGKGSKPPEPQSLFPVSASIGDTIVIRGRYFSNNPVSCSVYFGDVRASILSSSTEQLKVVVPSVNEPDVKVRVAVAGIFSVTNLDFHILLPVLASISPGSGACGDTVVITGNYFSVRQPDCQVFFSIREAQVLSVTRTEIKVIVPYSPQLSFKVKAVFDGVPTVNTLDFDIRLPVPLGISPQTGTFGDIVTLVGTYFPTDTTLFGVFFNDTKAVVTESSRTQIKVKVPTGNNISPVTITLKYYYNHSFPVQFTLEQASVDEVSPSKLTEWMNVTIRGSNFNPNWRMVRVEIGGLNAAVISSTTGEIVVNLPSGLASGQHQVVVTIISGSPVTWDGYLELESAWIKMADFPPSGRMGASGFSLGGKIYFGTGIEPYLQYTRDFWEYDPGSGQWTRKMDFPRLIAYAAGLTVNDMGYFALGRSSASPYNDIFRYDPQNNTWSKLAPIPGYSSTMDSPGFVIDGKIYVPAAGHLWMYDPASNSWTEKSYPAELGYFGGGAAFAINGKGYLGVGWVHEIGMDVNAFYEYDPVSDTWTRKANFPGQLRDNATSFSLMNGRGYVGLGLGKPEQVYLKDFWEYTPGTDTWTRIGDFPGTPRCGARAYVIGSDVYILAGFGEKYENDMWKYSPLY